MFLGGDPPHCRPHRPHWQPHLFHFNIQPKGPEDISQSPFSSDSVRFGECQICKREKQ